MINTVEITLVITSLIGVGALLFKRYSLGAPLLEHEPRRPVPWGALPGCAIAFFFLLAAVLSATEKPTIGQPEELPAAATAASDMAVFYGVFLTVTAMFLSMSASQDGATVRDFGFPENWKTVRQDLGTGLAVGFLLFGPVLLVQAMVIPWFGGGSKNQVLLHAAENPGGWLFAVFFVGAAILAPILEELVFRLMFQGWLEKTELQLFSIPIGESDSTGTLGDRASRFGLTPGLAPILVSASVFAMIHLPAGPDFIALFPFGLIQGYVYQRTHRILPCIVSHGVFNAVSLSIVYVAALLHP